MNWRNAFVSLFFLGLAALFIGACAPKSIVTLEPSETTVYSQSDVNGVISDQPWNAAVRGNGIRLETLGNARLKELFERSVGAMSHSALAVG